MRHLTALVFLVAAVACGADPVDRAPTLPDPPRDAAGPDQFEQDPAGPNPPDPAEPEDPGATDRPPADFDANPFGEPVRTGSFDAAVVPGASGLAASRRFPGVLYLLDDREGTSAVHVLDPRGRIVGAIAVDGLDARDTEALAIGPCPGRDDSCLYVGDIGDNLRGRADVRVHRVVEPDLTSLLDGDPDPSRRVAASADTAVLRYPDGRHDAEALLADADGMLYVVTKPADGEDTVVYSSAFGDATWQRVGSLTLPAPRRPLLSAIVGNVVTGASADADGRVLLRTYDTVLLAPPTTADASLADLPDRDLREVPSPLLPQPEAVAWTIEQCGYATVSERIGAVWLVPCEPPPGS